VAGTMIAIPILNKTNGKDCVSDGKIKRAKTGKSRAEVTEERET
jgi:hypothetical protein